MIEFAQFGAGRIGAIHAGNLAGNPAARLRYVVDVNPKAAKKLADKYGAAVVDRDTAINDPKIGAVVIASSTDTHADLTVAAAKAGKAIFCEKPIDLSLRRVDACLRVVAAAGVKMLVGFNRRFDPSFKALHDRLRKGEIGVLEQVIITSRDPGLPPLEYLKVSGGQLRDMTIHDFDMARWLLGEEVETVQAAASVLTDAKIGELGDYDSVNVILRTKSGRQAIITNSRRAAYGYDQRIEVLGSSGMVAAQNHGENRITFADKAGFHDAPLLNFFMTRYIAAYANEIAGFIAAIQAGTETPTTGHDGLMALALAEAALKSVAEGRSVKVSEIL